MPARPAIDYVLNGLEAAPLVQKKLLSGFTDWDAEIDPDRFTPREMVAHLADWESIWMDRVHRFVHEDHPFLPSIDEGQIAIDHRYTAQDPLANLERYASRRTELLTLLRGLDEDSWARTGHREYIGDLTLFDLAAIVTGHDGYHLKQTLIYIS